MLSRAPFSATLAHRRPTSSIGAHTELEYTRHRRRRSADARPTTSVVRDDMLMPGLFDSTTAPFYLQGTARVGIRSHNRHRGPRTSVPASPSAPLHPPTLSPPHPPWPIDAAAAHDTRSETVYRPRAPLKLKAAAVAACAVVIPCRPCHPMPISTQTRSRCVLQALLRTRQL